MTTSLMSTAGLKAVRGELARLRRSSRLEIEQRLGDEPGSLRESANSALVALDRGHPTNGSVGAT
jgi:hypothetical protein